MSYELDVKMHHAVQSKDLLEDARNVLCSLLGLEHCPALSMKRIEEGRREEVHDAVVGFEGSLFLIELFPVEAFCDLCVFDVGTHPDVSEEEEGFHASFGVRADAAHMCFALAASLAIALARRQGARIWDSTTVWVAGEEDEHSPDEFISALAVQGWFVDLRKRAKKLFKARKSPRIWGKWGRKVPPKTNGES